MEYHCDPWRSVPELHRLVFHPGLWGVAEQLAGEPLRVFSSEILLKRPGLSSPTAAHDDAPAVSVEPVAVGLTAWVALVDMPPERGCLTFLGGSHRRALRPDVVDVELWDVFGGWPELVWQPRTTVPVRAGDVTFHHVRTVHSAGANLSDQLRLSATLTWVPVTARYRPQPGGEELDGIALGARLPDDLFPVRR